jgi:dTDP-4-amino-4,6-dideoxygalactose transaminase
MIPMINLQKQFEVLREEILHSVADVLESSRYVLGPHVTRLEQEVASYTGSATAVGVASGTDALHLALRALNMGPGDEVITTPFTFFATVEAILYEGAKPVFVDIEPQTMNMDPALIEAQVTDRTRAILPVHIFGHPADMPRILDIAGRRGLAIVEDCAQAFGAAVGGQRVGGMGDVGCFSFYPSKNLGACGDGGMIAVREASAAERLLSLRNHGSGGNYLHEEVGFNSRLDELQAAILLVKFKQIDDYNRLRRRKADLYRSFLGSRVQCPVELDGYYHVYHQFTIRSPERDVIREGLSREGVSSMVYYPVPLHLQPALKSLGYGAGDFPVAEQACREVLSLPICPHLDDADVERVARCILGA